MGNVYTEFNLPVTFFLGQVKAGKCGINGQTNGQEAILMSPPLDGVTGQLWGTGARAPVNFQQQSFFSAHFRSSGRTHFITADCIWFPVQERRSITLKADLKSFPARALSRGPGSRL